MNSDAAGNVGARPLLQVKNLSVRVEARHLMEIDYLKICVGQRVGLTGPSGAGKTTLARLIIDSALGRAIDAAVVIGAQSVGYVPQGGGVLPWYSLRDNITAVNKIHVVPDSLKANIPELINIFDLNLVLDSPTGKMSGGEVRRSALLLGVIQDCDFMILDEPLNGVDFDRKMIILDYIREEAIRRALGLLVISHDPDVLRALCNSVVFIAGAPARISECVDVLKNLAGIRTTVRERLSSV